MDDAAWQDAIPSHPLSDWRGAEEWVTQKRPATTGNSRQTMLKSPLVLSFNGHVNA
jgi:hypothetical protein